MMYECQSCGRKFQRPRLCWEARGEAAGHPAYEQISVCPSCGGGYTDGPRGGR